MSNKGMIGTDLVTQIGILVHDIEAASAAYARFLGCQTPAWRWTDIQVKAQTKYRGQPSKARAKLAFFQVGPGLQLELIEPDQQPSTWRHDLDQKGEGFHHIAFVVKGMQERLATLNATGMQTLQTGEYEGGRYAYVDALKDLKLVLELLEND